MDLFRPLALSCLSLTLAACADPEFTNDGGPDAQVQDTGTPTDTGVVDRGVKDTGVTDTGVVDEGQPDQGTVDTGPADTGTPDAGGPTGFPIRIAYSATANDVLLEELFLTDTSTSRRTVTATLAGGDAGGKKQAETAGVRGFVWRPDGEGIVYRAQQDTFNRVDLYYAPVQGAFTAAPLRISPPNTTSGADLGTFANTFSSRNAYIFFSQSSMTEGTRLRTANLAAVNPASAALSQNLSVSNFLAPSGSRIMFQDILVSASDRDLWLADAAAAPPRFDRTRVNPGANIGFGSAAAWSPLGDQVAYVADERGTRLFELFVADVSGTAVSNRVRVHFQMPANSDARARRGSVGYAFDGNHLAYIGNPRVPAESDLFLIDLNARLPQPFVALSGTVAAGASGVDRLQWSPSGDTLFYVSEQDLDQANELYLADRSNPGTAYKINAALPAGERVQNERWLDQGTVLYEVSTNTGQRRLFIADVRVPRAITRTEVNGPLLGDESMGAYQLAPGNREIVFRVDDRTNQSSAFWRAEIQMGTLVSPATLVTRTGFRASFCGAPDGRWAVVAPLDEADRQELYLYVPGASPEFQKISGPLVADGQVRGCAFPP